MRGGGGGLFGRFLSEVEELLQLRQQLRSGQVRRRRGRREVR